MALYKEDMRAGFTGLIVGAVVLFALLYGIVRLTNAHYADKPAAHGAPAATH